MKIFRRGQASIEFALILPIFAMLLFALVYVGFLFIDVVTLVSAAAAAARSAAASTDGEPSNAVKKQIKKTNLFLYWYTIKHNKVDEDGKQINDSEGNPEVEIHLKRIMTGDAEVDANVFTYGIQANLKENVKNNAVLGKILPEAYTVVKSAYKE